MVNSHAILDFGFCEKFERRLPALKAFQDGFWIDSQDLSAFLYIKEWLVINQYAWC
jgi:hypothetical protein